MAAIKMDFSCFFNKGAFLGSFKNGKRVISVVMMIDQFVQQDI